MAADRSDIGHCVKTLVKQTQSPRAIDMQKLKRLGRYFKGRPRVVQRFVRQREPTRIDAYGDSDNAGDPESRRSTVGQIIMLGQHTVKHSCT